MAFFSNHFSVEDKSPLVQSFVEKYKAKYNTVPDAFAALGYDAAKLLADAITRAGSTDSDKLVDALEKTDYVGTIGRVQFNGKDSPNPHALKVGPGTITGLMLQWQDGKQTNLWPAKVANGKLKFPKFIKIGAAN